MRMAGKPAGAWICSLPEQGRRQAAGASERLVALQRKKAISKFGKRIQLGLMRAAPF